MLVSGRGGMQFACRERVRRSVSRGPSLPLPMMTDPTELHLRRRAISLGARLYNVNGQTREEDEDREEELREHIRDLPEDLQVIALGVKGRMRHVPRDYDKGVWRSRAFWFRRAKESWRRYYP